MNKKMNMLLAGAAGVAFFMLNNQQSADGVKVGKSGGAGFGGGGGGGGGSVGALGDALKGIVEGEPTATSPTRDPLKEESLLVQNESFIPDQEMGAPVVSGGGVKFDDARKELF